MSVVNKREIEKETWENRRECSSMLKLLTLVNDNDNENDDDDDNDNVNGN